MIQISAEAAATGPAVAGPVEAGGDLLASGSGDKPIEQEQR